MDFSLDTSEKVISLIVGVITLVSFAFFRKKRRSDSETVPTASSNTATVTGGSQIVNVNVGELTALAAPDSAEPTVASEIDMVKLKNSTRILFIDDDRGIRIPGVLTKMGWVHMKTIKDLSSLEDPSLIEADVVFVDINGVGRKMQYVDQGLGLALDIKRRHAAKKVVIYSSEEKGKMFHEALKQADYSLPKTAEPIRFEDAILRVLGK
ncbi:TPA: hypothetical protein UL939_000487 [Stenotrophomonas maltophilia]|nr:hypothetical protein [Stenotrophomonas maltophilia]